MNVSEICNNLMPFLRIIAYLMKILQWAIPIILIVLVTFDFVKSLMANDEKNLERAKSVAVKRLVYAVVVFLIPVVVRFAFRILSGNLSAGGLEASPTSWISCFNKALNEV